MALMETWEDNSFDAIVTDPPYASGGMSTTARMADPLKKYQVTGTRKIYPSFQNDTRDQRTHLLWTIRWMEQAFRLTKNEGWLMVFSDWRQLPLTSDALQIAGWTWRGIVSWDKTESCRPQLGLFRNQCEYILTATKGRYNKTVRTCPAGCVRTPMFSKDKLHLTAKPIPLMEHLLGILPP